MSSNGSANVKHSEAMSDEIITAMSAACGASIFLFELLLKKNLESICFPSYGMNANSLQAWVLIILLASWAKKKEKTRRREKRKEKQFVRLPARVLNSRPSRFPILYTNA